MDVSGATSFAAQEVATNKVQTGFDVLTKTLQKGEQNEINAKQRSALAEQTGKGTLIDIKA